jgi:hypothetical protein
MGRPGKNLSAYALRSHTGDHPFMLQDDSDGSSDD